MRQGLNRTLVTDSPSMDMLKGEQIAAANLTDWRKLAQGLHARYLVADFGTGARFVAAVGEAGDALGHHPRVSIGNGYVDLKLVSDDAVYRDDEGTEHVVEWVTQQDVDLARCRRLRPSGQRGRGRSRCRHPWSGAPRAAARHADRRRHGGVVPRCAAAGGRAARRRRR